MTVAVAHQASSSSREVALREGAREAQFRDTDLAVLDLTDKAGADLLIIGARRRSAVG